jgi:predicted transcriptional regulator
MGLPAELWETVRKLSSLEARTEDVMRSMERIENKVDNLIDRISRVEARYEQLRENVRNEILAEIKADVARAQVLLELQRVASSRSDGEHLLPAKPPSQLRETAEWKPSGAPD